MLDAAYGYERADIARSLEALLHIKALAIDSAPLVGNAARRYRDTSADFADCLFHLTAQQVGCDQTVTFDKGAARNAGMTLLTWRFAMAWRWRNCLVP